MGTESVGRGMVLEVRGRSALVLTDGGEFRWVPLKGGPGELGREVRFIRRQSSPVSLLLWPALVMASLVALMVLTPPLAAPGPVVARISLDINPSFELAVDARERVVEAIGVDRSGMELVRAAGSVRGQDLGTVLERLLRVAREQRYLDPAGPNVLVLAVTSFLPGQEWPIGRIEVIGERMKAAAHRELAGAEGITLASLQVSPKVWQEARAVGLSAGRYAVLLRAQGRGLKLEVEDVREGRLGEAISRAGGSAAEIVGGEDLLEAIEDLADKFRERNRIRRPRGDEGEDEQDERPDRRNQEDEGEDEGERPEPGLGREGAPQPPGQDRGGRDGRGDREDEEEDEGEERGRRRGRGREHDRPPGGAPPVRPENGEPESGNSDI